MFFLPRTILFNRIIIMLTAVLCLACSGLILKAYAQSNEHALNATKEVHTDSYANEEIIEFEGDPDLVGHLKEEETSYASYKDPSHNATMEISHKQITTNSILASNSSVPVAKAEPLVKLVPPKGPMQPGALRLFRLIPPTIFENTIEGMREDEKQMLMNTGENDFWVLTALSENELIIESKAPEANTQASLHLFKVDNGDIIIAIGVSSGDFCALELWRYFKGHQGIIPVAMPDEPAASDFFKADNALPKDTDVSMLICLDPVKAVLFAKPLIWSPSGLEQIKLDTSVSYSWNGRIFVKTIKPLQ